MRSVGGIVLGRLSLDRCHRRLMELMDYDALRREQAEARARGIWRGIGLSVFIEQTAVGPSLYGSLEVRVAAHEACRLTLEPDGRVRCATSITDQGQGTSSALVQVVADELGLDPAVVEIVTGDTAETPFGGGAWASRGTALGGEAALRAARKLRQNVLTIAGSLLQQEPAALRLDSGTIVNAAGLAQLTLADLAATVAYRAHTIPLDPLPPLDVVESFAPRDHTLRDGERHPGRPRGGRSRTSAPSACSTSGWSTIAAA